MNRKFKLTNVMNSLMLKRKGNSRLSNSTWFLLILMTIFMWQCEKDEFKGETKGVCPEVVSTDPANEATNMATSKIISATFNEAMNPASINNEIFTLKQGTIPVSGIITYTGQIAAFIPFAPLEANKTYTGTITKKVKDLDGNYPLKIYVWSYWVSVLNYSNSIMSDSCIKYSVDQISIISRFLRNGLISSFTRLMSIEANLSFNSFLNSPCERFLIDASFSLCAARSMK